MLINNLNFALQCAGISHTTSVIENECDKIRTIDDVLAYNQKSNHFLWNWLPAIVYEKFGLDIYLNNIFGTPTKKCYVMLHPAFINFKELLLKELQKLDVEIVEKQLKFSLSNISKVYGGFPWFRSYVMLCNDLNCFEKVTTVFQVEYFSNNSIDVIDMIRKWKNKYRDSLAPRIKKSYENEEFPGIVNAFHSPTYIEMERFSLLLTEINEK